MLNFFIEPYENELLYSIVARYHFYSKNIDLKDTLVDLFETPNVIPTVYFPSRLNQLCNQLSLKNIYNPEYLINNHTLFPVYRPFISTKAANKIKKDMKNGDGKGIYTKIGVVAGSICKKDGLSYCPKCAVEQKQRLGEPYFMCIHQVQGVIVCPIHGCLLKQYYEKFTDVSRIEFIRMKYEFLDLQQQFEKDTNIDTHFRNIAANIYHLYDNSLSDWNQKKVHNQYLNYIDKKKLSTFSGNVRQTNLFEEFTTHYGKNLLTKLECEIDNDNEYNWLKVITRKPGRAVHPLRHMLLIQFLSNNIQEFFHSYSTKARPFGDGPWYCLNPVSDHFQCKVVTRCTITIDSKSRQPVGTFTCGCGFKYSRKGPDKCESDKYKVGRIKEFGTVWEDKLIYYLTRRSYGIRELAKVMRCDPKTIVKFAERFQLRDKLAGKMTILKENDCQRKNNPTELEKIYKGDIQDYIKKNQACTITQARTALKKQFAWLYRHDKEWLQNVFSLKLHSSKNDCSKKVDWNERDKQILIRVIEVQKTLKESERPVRITLSLLGKKSGLSAILEKKLDKIPQTKAFINQILETIEDFQVRRVNDVCKKLFEEKGHITRWRIYRLAGLRKNISPKVKEQIETNIIRYQGGMYIDN